MCHAEPPLARHLLLAVLNGLQGEQQTPRYARSATGAGQCMCHAEPPLARHPLLAVSNGVHGEQQTPRFALREVTFVHAFALNPSSVSNCRLVRTPPPPV